ncbi:MAG: hypothetical protein ACREFQ_14580, partial [Stellaceae bacterium]
MSGIKNNIAVRRVLALVLLALAWEAAARAGWLDPFYFPAPSKVGAVIVQLFADGSIWTHLEATFAAALLGLVLGFAAGIVLGFVAALTPLLADLLEPIMMLLNA